MSKFAGLFFLFVATTASAGLYNIHPYPTTGYVALIQALADASFENCVTVEAPESDGLVQSVTCDYVGTDRVRTPISDLTIRAYGGYNKDFLENKINAINGVQEYVCVRSLNGADASVVGITCRLTE